MFGALPLSASRGLSTKRDVVGFLFGAVGRLHAPPRSSQLTGLCNGAAAAGWTAAASRRLAAKKALTLSQIGFSSNYLTLVR